MDRPTTTPTGSRIRQLRMESGIRQVELARRVNVSASYLNLIEHNRRRIGGKLLIDLAAALETVPEALSEGAKAATVRSLQQVASASRSTPPPEADRSQAFAERFPGWAALVVAQSRRIADLEQTVAGLSDRLTHNPHLAASLHDMMSTVTAIRSSAAILSDTPDIEPQWQQRFQRNILEDSERLVDGSRRLAAFLGPQAERQMNIRSPREEFEAFLDAAGHRFADIAAGSDSPETAIGQSPFLVSQSGRELARRWLSRYLEDISALPDVILEKTAGALAEDPFAIAANLGLSPALVMRRLSGLDRGPGAAERGLAVADGSGTLTYVKDAEGFQMPRLGAGCPLWPLYHALIRPMSPVHSFVTLPESSAGTFEVFAYCEIRQPRGLAGPMIVEATMLVTAASVTAREGQPVGPACPVCPRADCAARREPSILTGGL